MHGDGDGLGGVPFEQVGGQADALAAEDQHGGTRVGDLLESTRAARGEEERRPQRRQRALEVGPARPDRRVDPRPVVEPGPANLLFVQREAERADEVKLRADGQTGPPGVSRVPVDLRLDQHDVKIAHRGLHSAGEELVFTRRQIARQLDLAEADATEAEHVAAERGEDPADLVVRAADDGDRRQRARFAGNVQARVHGVARQRLERADLRLVTVVQHQLGRQRRERPRQRRLVGPRHRALRMREPLDLRPVGAPDAGAPRCRGRAVPPDAARRRAAPPARARRPSDGADRGAPSRSRAAC